MLLPEFLRWTAVAALVAAVIRFRPTGFWSIGPRQPLVLARTTAGAGRFRSSAA